MRDTCVATPRTGSIFKSSRNKGQRMAPRQSLHEDDLEPEPCTSPSENECSITPATYSQQQQQQLISCAGGPHEAPDPALMDFWVLLQQTQTNLQEMLMDLETAKVELDLANERAEDAQQQVNTFRIQLSASEQKNIALEAQLQSCQTKEAQSSSRVSALTQLNTQLTTEVQQAQSAAAALELKLERVHGRLLTAQRDAAAAAAAAAANLQDEAAQHEAAAAAKAAGDAVMGQLKAEVGQLKSELASAQAKASRAELELAVARTKVLVAQQEAASSRDRSQTLEVELARLHTDLGAAVARAEVMSEEKSKFESQVETLSSRLAKKEARLRGSMDALAKASYKLRASFAAEGGSLDQVLENMPCTNAQIRSDIAVKAAALKRQASNPLDNLFSPKAQTQPFCSNPNTPRVAAVHAAFTPGSSPPHPAAQAAAALDVAHQKQGRGSGAVTPGGESKKTPRGELFAPRDGSDQKKTTPRGSLVALLTSRRRSSNDDRQSDTGSCSGSAVPSGATSPAAAPADAASAAAATTAAISAAVSAVDWSSPIFKRQRTVPGTPGRASITSGQQQRSNSSSRRGSLSSSGSSGSIISQTSRSLLSPRFLMPSKIPMLSKVSEADSSGSSTSRSGDQRIKTSVEAAAPAGGVAPSAALPPLSGGGRRRSSGTWGAATSSSSHQAAGAAQKPDKLRALVTSIEAAWFHRPHHNHHQHDKPLVASVADSCPPTCSSSDAGGGQAPAATRSMPEGPADAAGNLAGFSFARSSSSGGGGDGSAVVEDGNRRLSASSREASGRWGSAATSRQLSEAGVDPATPDASQTQGALPDLAAAATAAAAVHRAEAGYKNQGADAFVGRIEVDATGSVASEVSDAAGAAAAGGNVSPVPVSRRAPDADAGILAASLSDWPLQPGSATAIPPEEKEAAAAGTAEDTAAPNDNQVAAAGSGAHLTAGQQQAETPLIVRSSAAVDGADSEAAEGTEALVTAAGVTTAAGQQQQQPSVQEDTQGGVVAVAEAGEAGRVRAAAADEVEAHANQLAANIVRVFARRHALLVAVLPAVAGAVFAVIGGVSLAQAKKMHRQSGTTSTDRPGTVLAAGGASVSSAVPAEASAAADAEAPSTTAAVSGPPRSVGPREGRGDNKSRGHVVNKGAARPIYCL